MEAKWRFRLGLLVLLIVGVTLASLPLDKVALDQLPMHGWLRGALGLILRVLPKIGDAMMIAAILAAIVDEAAKRALLKDFARDVSSHIIGRLLPPELREHIHQYLGIEFVRVNWDITYTIQELAGHQGFVELKTEAEYDMQNRSTSPKNYQFYYEVEESWFPEIGKTRITEVKAANFFEYIEGDKDLKLQHTRGFVAFSKDVELLPYEPEHRQYGFRIESIECFKDSYSCPFIASYPVVGLTFTVRYPKDKLQVDLSLSFDDVQEVATKQDLEHGIRWTITKPILPGQALFTRWERKPEQAVK